MADQQQEWLDFAKSMALEAGDIMRKYFGKKQTLISKQTIQS